MNPKKTWSKPTILQISKSNVNSSSGFLGGAEVVKYCSGSVLYTDTRIIFFGDYTLSTSDVIMDNVAKLPIKPKFAIKSLEYSTFRLLDLYSID